MFPKWLQNKQLSDDINQVIVEMRKSGHKLRQIADICSIPRGTVSDGIVRFWCRGSIENKPQTSRCSLLDAKDKKVLV